MNGCYREEGSGLHSSGCSSPEGQPAPDPTPSPKCPGSPASEKKPVLRRLPPWCQAQPWAWAATPVSTSKLWNSEPRPTLHTSTHPLSLSARRPRSRPCITLCPAFALRGTLFLGPSELHPRPCSSALDSSTSEALRFPWFPVLASLLRNSLGLWGFARK